jgi:hypothetical protein
LEVEGYALQPERCTGLKVYSGSCTLLGPENREIPSVRIPIGERLMIESHGCNTFEGFAQLNVSWGRLSED